MFSNRSIVALGSSAYCTPTKYWLPLFVVDPEVAVDRHAGVHGRDHLLNHVAGGEADVGRLLPVDLDDQVRGVEALGDVHVGGPADLPATFRRIS